MRSIKVLNFFNLHNYLYYNVMRKKYVLLEIFNTEAILLLELYFGLSISRKAEKLWSSM